MSINNPVDAIALHNYTILKRLLTRLPFFLAQLFPLVPPQNFLPTIKKRVLLQRSMYYEHKILNHFRKLLLL